MKMVNKICVVGLGYIGLPTAAVFAGKGIDVVGVDTRKDLVEAVNQGRPHFGEPNLDTLVRRVVEDKKLRATMTPEPADAFLIAVPTPFKGNKQPDLSYIEAAATSIAPMLEKGNLIILESTSPIGATEMMTNLLAGLRKDLSFPTQLGELSDIRVAHCPERVLRGAHP